MLVQKGNVIMKLSDYFSNLNLIEIDSKINKLLRVGDKVYLNPEHRYRRSSHYSKLKIDTPYEVVVLAATSNSIAEIKLENGNNYSVIIEDFMVDESFINQSKVISGSKFIAVHPSGDPVTINVDIGTLGGEACYTDLPFLRVNNYQFVTPTTTGGEINERA